jgi:hypothetical protein
MQISNAKRDQSWDCCAILSRLIYSALEECFELELFKTSVSFSSIQMKSISFKSFVWISLIFPLLITIVYLNNADSKWTYTTARTKKIVWLNREDRDGRRNPDLRHGPIQHDNRLHYQYFGPGHRRFIPGPPRR